VTEWNNVTSFLKLNGFIDYIVENAINRDNLGKSTTKFWTSLSKNKTSTFQWLNGVPNMLEETFNTTGGDCVALGGEQLLATNCDSRQFYMCEAKPAT
jgi:hypothetical protein